MIKYLLDFDGDIDINDLTFCMSIVTLTPTHIL